MTIFIPGNVPSSKNSKQWTGRYLVNSKVVNNYLVKYEKNWAIACSQFFKLTANLEYPLNIGFYFIRNSKRKFDYVNAAQLPLDLMVKHGWIPDDDSNHIVPYFLGFKIDKEKPGVQIKVSPFQCH